MSNIVFIRLFSAFCLVTQLLSIIPIQSEPAKETPLFYWDARPQLGFSNFGDALSVCIVERILERSIVTTTDPTLNQKKFLVIGSIVNYATNGDTLWGTGVNGKLLLNKLLIANLLFHLHFLE